LVKVLITGGAGFIGSHLVDRLINDGYDVVVLDNFFSGRRENLSRYFGKANFCLIEGDIRNRIHVKNALKNVDYVFHLAAIVSVDFSIKKPLLVNDVNVKGTLNVLEESLKAGVKRFVLASSCAVYGEHVKLPVAEDHPTMPLSPYGVSKLAAEHYCRLFSKVYGLETVCLRFFNVYGSRQKGGSYGGVITKFIERLRKGKNLMVFGDGTQTRDFVYVSDVVEAMLLSIKGEKCVGETINIASGVETSINELVKILGSYFNLKDKRPIYVKAKPGEIYRSCADLERAKKLLNYEPKFSLVDGLKRMLADEGI